MNVRARLGGGFAQARQRALLAVHISGKFRVRQHQRKLSEEVRAGKRAEGRFDVLRQSGNAVVCKWFTVKLDFLRRRGKTASDAAVIACVFFVRRLYGS